MCPICWISGFIAAIFGGSLIAVVNHPISWILSVLLIAYAAYKFYEAKKRGNIIENGKMMFAYQAQKAFELWNNLKPEINEQVLKLLDD